MCYLVRQQQAGAAERAGVTQPPSFDRVRPRWAGAVAAALIGGVALAALVVPQSTSPIMNAKDSAPAAPVASKALPVSTGGDVQKSSALPDDGVPSTSDVAKASVGHCEHGL